MDEYASWMEMVETLSGIDKNTPPEFVLDKAHEAADMILKLHDRISILEEEVILLLCQIPAWFPVEEEYPEDEQRPEFNETVIITDGFAPALAIYSKLENGPGEFVDICVPPHIKPVWWMHMPELPEVGQ